MKDNENTFMVVLVLASTLAMSLALAFVLAIYGYMDHMYGNISLRAGNADLKCMDSPCWNQKR